MKLKKKIVGLILAFVTVVSMVPLSGLTAQAASFINLFTSIYIEYSQNCTDFSSQYKYSEIAADIRSSAATCQDGCLLDDVYICASPIGYPGYGNRQIVSNTDEYLDPNRETWIVFSVRATKANKEEYDFPLNPDYRFPVSFYFNGELRGDAFADGYNANSKTMQIYVPVYLSYESGIISVDITNTQSNIAAGESMQLYAALESYGVISHSVTWTLSGAESENTTISADGYLTVDRTETAEYLTVTAISNVDSSKWDSFTLTVEPAVPVINSVNISYPSTSSLSLNRNSSLQFSAIVDGDADPTILWSISGNGDADTTIDNTGLLYIGDEETANTINVTATSQYDSTKSATVAVTVLNPYVIVYKITSVSFVPNIMTMEIGQSCQLNPIVMGNAPHDLTWEMRNNSSSSTRVSDTGFVEIGWDETSPAVVAWATSVFDPSKQNGVAILINNPNDITSMSITPVNPIVSIGESLQLTANVTGTGNLNVSWSVSGNTDSDTCISQNGLLTIGDEEEAEQIQVRAQSVANPTKTASTNVTVRFHNPEVLTPSIDTVTVSPKNRTVQAGNSIQLSANVTGNASDHSVTWQVSGNNNSGTYITNNGLLHISASETSTNLLVKAISNVDNTKYDSATVYVSIPRYIESVTVTPRDAIVERGEYLQLNVTLVGTADKEVAWILSESESEDTYLTDDGLLYVAEDETSEYVVVAAVSMFDYTKSDYVYVTVTEAQYIESVSIQGNPESAMTGESVSLQANVVGSADPTVIWSVSGNSSNGTYITESGLLVIAEDEQEGFLSVTATSVFDSTKFCTESIYVNIPRYIESVTVTPNHPTLMPGEDIQFYEHVTGNADSSVVWSVSGNTDEDTLITSNGHLYVGANENAAMIAVVATSNFDQTKYGVMNVSIQHPLSIESVIVTPDNQIVSPAEQLQFNAAVTGTANHSVVWSVSGNQDSNTTISTSGVLTVGANETEEIIYVTATSAFDSTKSDTVSVNVAISRYIESVTVRPKNGSVDVGNGMYFDVSVVGNANSNVTWTIIGQTDDDTTINRNGLLIIGDEETTEEIYVTATSVFDPTKFDTVCVRIIQPPHIKSVTAYPTGEQVRTGEGLQFGVDVVGNTDLSVIWSISGNTDSNTTISADGLLTVGRDENATTIYLTATSVADPSKSGTVEVIIEKFYTGFVTINGTKYYFNDDGIVCTGWIRVNDECYYGALNGGAIQTGWVYVGNGRYYMDEEGIMQTGIVDVDGTLYFLDGTGTVYTGWIAYDGNWYFGLSDGALYIGWLNDGQKKFYLNSNGVMLTGLASVDGAKYIFDSNGKTQTGWIDYDGKWYYANSSGVLQTGWKSISNAWYYMDSSGIMQTGIVNVDGKKYFLNDKGVMQTGWIDYDGKWYYANSNGALQIGWVSSGGVWYYTDNNGVMQTGWVQVGQSWYYLNSSGVMQTGWITINGAKYYLSSNGEMKTGWISANGNWYYANSSGAMQTGWVSVGNIWYFMDSNGVMQTGWVQVGANWYYLNGNGAMQTGWVQVGASWFYLNSNGAMQTGWLTINGTKYYLSSNGAMQTGWILLGNNWYYANSSGAIQTGWITVDGVRYYMDANGVMQ